MNDSAPIALITGARGGIGRALAERLFRQGWQVVAVGRDLAALQAVPAHSRIAADTSTPEGAQQAIAQCRQALGRAPDRLAHCLGSAWNTPLHRSRADQVREVLRVNLDSALYMLAAWIDGVREPAQPGAAVLVSSVVARIGVAQHEVVAAAKGGVEALVRSAAASHAGAGLRINAVAPGLTETPMTAGLLKLPAAREGAARQYPLGGVQSPEQVAGVMAWLLSDAADRITGQVLPVDGGFSAIRPMVK